MFYFHSQSGKSVNWQPDKTNWKWPIYLSLAIWISLPVQYQLHKGIKIPDYMDKVEK